MEGAGVLVGVVCIAAIILQTWEWGCPIGSIVGGILDAFLCLH